MTSLRVSHNFKTPQMCFGKLQIWPKSKIFQNHQKSINIDFCDNFICRSLDLILKYTVCKFYVAQKFLRKMRIFWIWKKNSIFFLFFLQPNFFNLNYYWNRTKQCVLVKKSFFHFFFFFQIQNILISLKTIVQT